MNALDWLNPYRWLLLGGMALALLAGGSVLVHRHDAAQQKVGEQRVQKRWDAETKRLEDAALAESQAKAKESLRRVEAQERNQRAKDDELAVARAAADRNAAAADQLRDQSASAAREWAARLANSPAAGDLEAAGAAISVCTDLLGRADRRAGLLASYADTARAAGLKCERDYDALTVKP